jgi:ketosteroid isomerase-like protein
VNEVRTIKEMVRGITASWRYGRFDDLHRFYRPDVVFVHPGFGGRVEGREACVASYREFLATATVHEYAEDEPAINVFGDTAVAVTRFTIDYELQGARHHEKGHDVLILTRDTDGWRVAWRTLVPEPPAL